MSFGFLFFSFVTAVYPGVGVPLWYRNAVQKIMEILMKANCCRWYVVCVLLLSSMILVVSAASASSKKKTDAKANCDIQAGACVQALGEGSVTLEILPRPVKAMADLTFQVTVEGVSPDGNPGIDLDMPGMSMGPNHVTMEKISDSAYSGTGVVVRCPSGRTLWQADVTIPGIGTKAFRFDVVY